MEFHINNNFFSDNINFDINNVVVKSLFKEYNVIYENIDNSYIVNNLIGINDFLIIDHNVFKLHNSFYNSLKNKYIVDAIEEKKTMSIVMEIVDYLTKAKITKNSKKTWAARLRTTDSSTAMGCNWRLLRRAGS